MSYYDEFYSEPSEFEMQVEEFKQSLLKSVKEEFLAEMEALRTENQLLQEVKRNFAQIQLDYGNKEQQLEIERRNMLSTVRKERLSTLMKDFKVVMFRASSTFPLPPKCDKCDDRRQIKYETPLGKVAFEKCDCSVGEKFYVPEEYIATEFSIDRDNKKMRAWYKMKPGSHGDDDYCSLDGSSTFASAIYSPEMSYESIKQYDTFFKTIEDCQKYCDWLNQNKGE